MFLFLNFFLAEQTLGNHEFDDRIKGLVPFLKALNAPVVVSNIDDSFEPDLQGLYQKSTVIERDGKKIGIIGVILSTTNVRFLFRFTTTYKRLINKQKITANHQFGAFQILG